MVSLSFCIYHISRDAENSVKIAREPRFAAVILAQKECRCTHLLGLSFTGLGLAGGGGEL